MKLKHLAWLGVVLVPISVLGIYTAIRGLNRGMEVRAVMRRTVENMPLLGADYPRRTATENLRRYGDAMTAVDISRTPDDFQSAFREWARTWRDAADAIDRDGNAAKKGAEARLRAATENLNAMRQKYGG